jgi:hypothetical protein
MNLEKTIAQEIINRRKDPRTDGISESLSFVESIKRKDTLCFDTRVKVFTDDRERYYFWDRVKDCILNERDNFKS